MTFPALTSDANNGYLVTLVDQAKVDGGRTLPLVDSASLALAKQEIEAGGRGLNDLAFKDLHSGNLEKAKVLAGKALSRNPSDLVARAILNDVAKKADAAPAAAVPGGGNPAAPPDKAVDDLPGEPGDLNLQGNAVGLPPPNGDAVTREINESTALEQQWQKDVQATITLARSQVDTTPDVAAGLIRNKTSELRSETALRAEVRERLAGMLRAASKQIQQRIEENTARQQQINREAMAQRERQLANAELVRDQEKVNSLMKRFDALLAEAHQTLSDRAARDAMTEVNEAGQIARASNPNATPTMVVGLHTARFQTGLDDIMAIRVAKQKGFVDSMYQTERSHVPVPDDPPIVYPDAEIWKELTAQRKEKYSSHGTLEAQRRRRKKSTRR